MLRAAIVSYKLLVEVTNRTLFLFSLTAFLLSSSGRATTPAEDAATCGACHDEQPKKIATSAHASMACSTCHPHHEEFPHPEGIPKPQCGSCHQRESRSYTLGIHGRERAKGNEAAPDCAVCHSAAHETQPAGTEAFRKNVPSLCGTCHGEIESQYEQSVHGQAVARGIIAAPVCTSCHGEHEIQPPKNPASTVNAAHIPETCGRCHGDVQLTRRFNMPRDTLVSYESSFHGLALKAGRETVANCASCHGIHNILPPEDPRSTINPRNLPKTCGKCHAGAGASVTLSRVHWVAGRQEPRPVTWVRVGYTVLIPLVIGLMLLNVCGDWIRKMVVLRFRPGRTPVLRPKLARFRMPPTERFQHGVLMLSFTVLAWSGFALVYPDAWWALPLSHWETTWPVRGTIHRIAAGVFVALCLVHVFELIVNRPARRRWLTVIPRHRDVPEAVGTFAYNLGLRSSPPMIWPQSWIAKAEYWALVWGALVMSMTGSLLWANTFFLRWLSKQWFDVATAIHFYEALLATLAILVWHFYYVMFDPDVYPMNPSWLTGFSIRSRKAEK